MPAAEDLLLRSNSRSDHTIMDSDLVSCNFDMFGFHEQHPETESRPLFSELPTRKKQLATWNSPSAGLGKGRDLGVVRKSWPGFEPLYFTNEIRP